MVPHIHEPVTPQHLYVSEGRRQASFLEDPKLWWSISTSTPPRARMVPYHPHR
jgi:hypothetical protein